MSDPMGLPDTLKLDADGRIDLDLRCVACGYNLRGLIPDGRCPECGTAIGRSAQGDLLRFCEPAWVETLASGMNWIVAGIVVGILAGVSIAIAAGLAGQSNWAILAVAVSGLVGLIGYWKVTTADPGQAEPDGLNARKLARGGQIGACLLSLTQWLDSLGPEILATVLAAAQIIVGLVALTATCVYARHLAMRIPDPRLAHQTRVLMWCWIVISVVAMPVIISAALLGGAAAGPAGGGATTTSNVAIAIMGISCVLGPVWLLFALWGIRLIDRYRKAFRQAAAEAQATWARSAQPKPDARNTQ